MSRKQQITVLLICACTSAYFARHAIVGKYGLEARSDLMQRASRLAHEVERAETVRARLEHETGLLDTASPDPDYVDEVARRLLGFAYPSDTITTMRKL